MRCTACVPRVHCDRLYSHAQHSQPILLPAAHLTCAAATTACLQTVWSRALGLPIERPKSVTMAWLEKTFGKAH